MKKRDKAGHLVFSAGPVIASEITRLRTALATAEAKRDAAYNEALEKAAKWHDANDYNYRQRPEILDYQTLAIEHGACARHLRALKKETPNADK